MWTNEQVQHLYRFTDPQRSELYRIPHIIDDWVVAFNGPILIAMVRNKFPSDVIIPELNGDKGAQILVDIMKKPWGFDQEVEIDVLRKWAGDPLSASPAVIQDIVIDRRLLSRTLITLPGPTLVLGSGSVSVLGAKQEVRYFTVRGPGWRVLIVEMLLPTRAGLPVFDQ